MKWEPFNKSDKTPLSLSCTEMAKFRLTFYLSISAHSCPAPGPGLLFRHSFCRFCQHQALRATTTSPTSTTISASLMLPQALLKMPPAMSFPWEMCNSPPLPAGERPKLPRLVFGSLVRLSGAGPRATHVDRSQTRGAHRGQRQGNEQPTQILPVCAQIKESQ